MTFDSWKTRSPDDERYRGIDSLGDEERDEEQCAHEYHHAEFSLLTGQWVCGKCGENLGWERASVRRRIHETWIDLRDWLRWTAWPACKRPFRAVRSWWRGDRKAPWRDEDEIPF